MAALGGAPKLDNILAPILDALSLDPHGFPGAGYGTIRLARTRLVMRGREIIPAMSVRFRIEPPATVSLLHVELTLPEDMEPCDEWPWK